MTVREALLALLAEGSKYGLQLRLDFEARTGEIWPLNVGQVYTTLRRLERDGRVESDAEEGPQNRYRITAAGREELNDWFTSPTVGASPPRDELVIKVLVAVGVPGIDVLSVVQNHRRWILEEMHAFTRLKEDVEPTDLGLLLVADAEIFRLDGYARWLDAVEGRLLAAGPSTVRLGSSPAPDNTSHPRVGTRR